MDTPEVDLGPEGGPRALRGRVVWQALLARTWPERFERPAVTELVWELAPLAVTVPIDRDDLHSLALRILCERVGRGPIARYYGDAWLDTPLRGAEDLVITAACAPIRRPKRTTDAWRDNVHGLLTAVLPTKLVGSTETGVWLDSHAFP